MLWKRKPSPDTEISPEEVATRLRAGERLQLVDVREPEELAIARIGAEVAAIPLGELTTRHRELDPELETVVICHHGIRSANAAAYLRQLGFVKVKNLIGGIERWSIQVDSSIRRY